MNFLKICALSKNLNFQESSPFFHMCICTTYFIYGLIWDPFCTNFSKMGKKLGAYRYVKTFVGLGGVGQGASGGRSSCGIRKEEANGGSGQLWRTRVKFWRSNVVTDLHVHTCTMCVYSLQLLSSRASLDLVTLIAKCTMCKFATIF